jgi:Protein of unknown function (DUF3293)
MTQITQIAPDKIKAYLSTDYRLGHTHQDIVLNIGQRSERLSVLFAHHGVSCGAFITAYNPRGAIQSDADNERCHVELAELLRELRIIPVEGSGSEDGSEWPAKRSWFAPGLDLEPSKRIGSLFDQDAIVWVGPDVVPQFKLPR